MSFDKGSTLICMDVSIPIPDSRPHSCAPNAALSFRLSLFSITSPFVDVPSSRLQFPLAAQHTLLCDVLTIITTAAHYVTGDQAPMTTTMVVCGWLHACTQQNMLYTGSWYIYLHIWSRTISWAECKQRRCYSQREWKSNFYMAKLIAFNLLRSCKLIFICWSPMVKIHAERGCVN